MKNRTEVPVKVGNVGHDARVQAPKLTGLAEAAAMIGRIGQLTTAEGFVIWVSVIDIRSAYGRTEFQVTAHVTGTGTAWVRTDRVDFRRSDDAPKVRGSAEIG